MSVFRGVYSLEQEDDFCRKDMLDDLQLAAELGKTLLERNKELETSLKQHQNIIEDQTQEIEYLTKQTVALREVNDSRLKIYEQLEVSIHDLERANHRLTLDAASDKKQIKSLCSSIDALETKCEEFQNTIEQITRELDVYKRKCEKVVRIEEKIIPRRIKGDNDALQDKQVQCDSTSQTSPPCRITASTSPIKSAPASIDVCDSAISDQDPEQLSAIMVQLRDFRTRSARDHRRVVELEEQLSAMVQENQQLENQLLNVSTRDEDMKSMHDELNTLDEVRQGQLCSRCLRTMDDNMSILDTEEEDDDNLSMMDALISETRYRSSVSLNIQQGYCEITSVLRRLLSVLWKMSTPTLYTLLLEFCFILRDYLLIPFFYSPRRLPLLLLCFIMTHDKLHIQY